MTCKELVVFCLHLHLQFKIDDSNHDLMALTNSKATELGFDSVPRGLELLVLEKFSVGAD